MTLRYGASMFESQSIENLDAATTARLLADRAAIIDLTHRYCWALDTKDYEALDSVFAPDANGDLLEDVRGRDAIKERIRRALDPLEQTQHLVSNHMVRVEGDRAWCRCYLQSQHVRRAADGGPGGWRGRGADPALGAGLAHDRAGRNVPGMNHTIKQ